MHVRVCVHMYICRVHKCGERLRVCRLYQQVEGSTVGGDLSGVASVSCASLAHWCCILRNAHLISFTVPHTHTCDRQCILETWQCRVATPEAAIVFPWKNGLPQGRLKPTNIYCIPCRLMLYQLSHQGSLAAYMYIRNTLS